MRLLIVSSEFPPGPGGIGTHAYQLAKHMASLGHDVVVLTPQSYVSLESIEQFNQQQAFIIHTLNKFPIPFIKAAYRWVVIRKIYRKYHPEVVVASGSRPVWLVALTLKNLSIPWIAIGHGGEFGDRGVLTNHLTKWAYSLADEIICVSHYTQKVMEQTGIKPKWATVIYNGADDERFHLLNDTQTLQIRENMGLTGQFILLTVGNVTPRKGQEVVIRALPAILRENPQTQYLMVGLPTYQNEFTQLAIQLGVQDHIKFLGLVEPEKIVQVFQACDLFLMTSQHSTDGDFEGFGIAVIEAALCGKPSIVADGSGLAEAVIDGVTGVVVPESDPEATAQVVINLWKEPARLKILGASAQQRAIMTFTWKNIARLYSQNIKEIVSRLCDY